MVDFNLISELDISDDVLAREIGDLNDDLSDLGVGFGDEESMLKPGSIITGRVIGKAGDDFIIDVGLKSEGTISRNEWDDTSSVDIGDEVSVWLDSIESEGGTIVLSKRKADRQLNWERIVATNDEGDVVEGRVMRKIKGGLLVDIGVPVFLPASQVDVRRPGDIGELIGQSIQAKILKIDTERRNIVISRRELIEADRAAAKGKLMAEIEVGQTRSGRVKNIANFGAFVDLGGIDGLLHITDMSWDRVAHPSDVLRIDDTVEIKILNIDFEKEKIALGLKQLSENPWEKIEDRYPVNTKVKGDVVNIMNYGAFVKLEAGVEGLVHISEMSWTRRINHPSELLSAGQEIEVIVLDVNKDKQEISLGMKQVEENPWTKVAEKYPQNTRIKGVVRNMTNYGVFVEIEEGIDGLLHISDLSWTKKISHPSELLKKSEEIECVVLDVDQDKQRIALGLRQLHEDPWEHAVPANYIPGQIVEGTVTKITNFGVFVELEEDLEGLLHVSELADHKVEDPHDEVKIGDRIQVKILRVDPVDRKIGLSKKRAEWSAEQEEEASKDEPRELRGGLHTSGEDHMTLTDVMRNMQTAAKSASEPAPTEASVEASGETASTDAESSDSDAVETADSADTTESVEEASVEEASVEDASVEAADEVKSEE